MRLSRLKFFAGGIAGGALGTLVAAADGSGIAWGAYAAAQGTITAFHLMTHYANDYFDRHADAFAVRTPYSGGSGALVDGSLAPGVALGAALRALRRASRARSFSPQPCIGRRPPYTAVAIALLAWAYSAPPFRLLARGLGECDTALVVAVLVPLCAFAAQRGTPTALVLAVALPGACAMLAMMLAVEYPDLDADRRAGKRNLVVRLGPERAKGLGVVAASATYAAVGVALVLGAPPAYALLEAVTLPAAVGLRSRAARPAARRSVGRRGARGARGRLLLYGRRGGGVRLRGAAPRARAASSGRNEARSSTRLLRT